MLGMWRHVGQGGFMLGACSGARTHLDHLWWPVAPCAALALERCVKLRGEPKVDEHGISILLNEHVGRLHVAVDVAVGVQRLVRVHDARGEETHDLFGELPVSIRGNHAEAIRGNQAHDLFGELLPLAEQVRERAALE